MSHAACRKVQPPATYDVRSATKNVKDPRIWLPILRGWRRLLKISVRLRALEHRADRLHERPRRLHAELHRHARPWAERLVHEVDIQRMLQRRIERVVVRYV